MINPDKRKYGTIDIKMEGSVTTNISIQVYRIMIKLDILVGNYIYDLHPRGAVSVVSRALLLCVPVSCLLT